MFKINKKFKNGPNKVFRSAFRCVQRLKAGQNTQQPFQILELLLALPKQHRYLRVNNYALKIPSTEILPQRYFFLHPFLIVTFQICLLNLSLPWNQHLNRDLVPVFVVPLVVEIVDLLVVVGLLLVAPLNLTVHCLLLFLIGLV